MGPNYNAPTNTAAGQIQERYESAINQSPENLNKGLLAGTEAADQMMQNSGDFENKIQSPLSAAIRSRFSQGYQRDKQALQNETSLQAKNSYFQKLQNASNMVAQEQKMNHEKQMAAYRAKRDKEKARGALVGQVLGIGGAVAGAMVGGPAGAMGGYQVGSGVGSMAGGG